MSVQLTTTDHIGPGIEADPGVGCGYGFAVVDGQGCREIPGHEGEYRWGGAHHSNHRVDPETDIAVTAFTQTGETSGLDDQGKLRALIYHAFLE